MASIKVGSAELDVWMTDPLTFIDSIKDEIADLKKKGATDIRLDWDIREYDNDNRLYLDGYREETPEEKARKDQEIEEGKRKRIKSLESELERLKNG